MIIEQIGMIDGVQTSPPSDSPLKDQFIRKVQNTLSRYSAIFNKGDNFYEFLLAFLHMPFLKRYLL